MKKVNKENLAMFIGVVIIIVCMIVTWTKVSEKAIHKMSHSYKNAQTMQIQKEEYKLTSLELTRYETIYEWVNNSTIIQIINNKGKKVNSYCIKNVKYWLNDNFFVTEDNNLSYVYFMLQDGIAVVKVQNIGTIDENAQGAYLEESETYWPVFQKEKELYVPVPNDWKTVETYSFTSVFHISEEVVKPNFSFELVPVKDLIIEDIAKTKTLNDNTGWQVYTQATLNLNGKVAIVCLK